MNNNMEKKAQLSIGILIVLACCTSCVAAIDPAAANSASGIIAIFFEWLYAIATLAIVSICWISRGVGLSGIIFGFLIIAKNCDLSLPTWIPLGIGIVLLIFSFIPIRPHKFTVIISNKLPSILKSTEKEPNTFNIWREILLPIAIAIISLIIEYHWFVPGK